MKLTHLLLLAPLVLALPQDKGATGGETEKQAQPVATIGKSAPSFSLNDHTGTKVTLGGAAPKWRVIACFPKAMTPG